MENEEGEHSEGFFEEVYLGSSKNTYTIVDFNTLTVCRNSNETIQYNYLPSAEVAPNGTDQIHNEFEGSQIVPQSCHVTDVNMILSASPALSSASAAEHETSITVKHSDTESKCPNWRSFCKQHPFQAIALSILYILIAVIFFPLLLLVFMICFVSYFTPDIEWLAHTLRPKKKP